MYENRDIQKKVRNQFLKLAESYPGGKDWVILDASQPIETIAKQVREHTDRIRSGGKERESLRLLWTLKPARLCDGL